MLLYVLSPTCTKRLSLFGHLKYKDPVKALIVSNDIFFFDNRFVTEKYARVNSTLWRSFIVKYL